MPWSSNKDLPKTVQGLPEGAKSAFRSAANSALASGKPEESAMKIGWTAVKNGWKKEGENWVKKSDELLTSGKIVKAVETEEDEGIVFGWASVMTKGGKPVKDDEDEIILPEDIEKAAYEFVINYRDQSDTHLYIGVGILCESMVLTKAKQEMLGIDLGMEAWWVGFKVNKANFPEVWEKIKKGEYPMFSIGGFAEKEEYDGETA
jgi:cation transport regulator ChaB